MPACRPGFQKTKKRWKEAPTYQDAKKPKSQKAKKKPNISSVRIATSLPGIPRPRAVKRISQLHNQKPDQAPDQDHQPRGRGRRPAHERVAVGGDDFQGGGDGFLGVRHPLKSLEEALEELLFAGPEGEDRGDGGVQHGGEREVRVRVTVK